MELYDLSGAQGNSAVDGGCAVRFDTMATGREVEMTAGADQTFDVDIAWPIWAGGYPTVKELLSVVAKLGGEIDSEVRAAVSKVEPSSDVLTTSFAPGGYRALSGIEPGERTQPNSIRADVVVTVAEPRADVVGAIAGSIESGLQEYVRRSLPGAARGANLYEVHAVPANGLTDMLDPDANLTIEDVAAVTSRGLGRDTTGFVRFAGGLQLARLSNGFSNSERLTRSTTLVAAMMFDPDILAAFESAGLALGDLQQELSVSPTLQPVVMSTPATLHPDLVRAVVTYVDLHPERSTIEPADLAVAVLDAGEQTAGLLVERFAKLPFDHDRARAELLALLERNQAPVSVVALAREYAPLVVGVDQLDETVGAIASEGRAVDRALLQRSVDRQFGGPTRDPARILVGLGAIDLDLRQALDEAGVWLPLLLTVDLDTVPSGSDLQPLLRAVRFEHGFRSDREQGDDQLGVAGEVNALCEVVVDRDVSPPLAVGLFGPWGSGKSFFMDMMRERIDARTKNRNDGQKVLQIRFNAWHYADTSLWANLAVEIFERLVDPEPVDPEEYEEWVRSHGDQHREKRTELLQQLETYRTARSALDEQRSTLEDQRQALLMRRATAERQRNAVVTRAPLTDVAGAVAADLQVQRHLQDVADELGFRPTVEELETLAAELRATSTSITRVWNASRRPRLAVVLLAAFVALLVGGAALVVRASREGDWLASMSMVAVALGSVVAGLARLARVGASGTRKALVLVESAFAAAARKEAEVRTTRSREEKQLDVQLAAAEDEVARATEAIAGLDERIAAAEAAAAALTVGRQLYDFLVDRAAGYQKHQGIIGMLHRDFRLLDAQMRAFRDPGEHGAPAPVLPSYERVILYVDDLDRCPPLKVLEVLQAVHLLLALPLFVVVVGVDPRWLKRSLRHAYRELIETEDGDSDDLESIPIEYLEKIFQIPLSVPDMQPKGFAQLIASLAPGVDFDPSARSAPVAPTPATGATADTVRHAVSATPKRAPLGVAPGSAAAAPIVADTDVPEVLPVLLDSGDRASRSIDLTTEELSFAATLAVLVPTPRATKRMMNTYRLLRSTQYAATGSRLLGTPGRPGEHQAILTLLAVSAGHPTGADRVLLELEGTDADSWPQFVEQLVGLGPQLDVAPLLQQTLTTTTLSDIEPYRSWGPRVARFTFSL